MAGPKNRELRRLVVISTFLLIVVQFLIVKSAWEDPEVGIIGKSNKAKSQGEVENNPLNFKLTSDNIDLLVNNKNSRNAISTNYKRLLRKYNTNLNKFSMLEKCQLYFNELYANEKDWHNGAFKDSHYNPDVFNKNLFFLKHKENIIAQKKAADLNKDNKKSDEEYVTNDDFYKVEHLHNKELDETIKTEQKYVDSMTNIRVFSQCYLNEKNSDYSHKFNDKKVIESLNLKLIHMNYEPYVVDIKVNEVQNQCHELESRMFPWLTHQLPVFKRWNGEISWGFPKIADNAVHAKKVKKKKKNPAQNKNLCFLHKFRDSLEGRGIVITGSDGQAEDMINLVKLLRGLNNELPIQIFHRGDLSKENQEKIVKVAREPFKIPKELFDKIPVQEIPNGFRQQEVWFADVSSSIHNDYKEYFARFYMKFLAYFFSTFEEVLLMDADSIPLVQPSSFFKLKPYRRTNTIFFKDRTSLEYLSDHDVAFFKKLLPSRIDEILFKLPKVTSKTLNNNLFAKKYKHSMEAGLFAINKKQKFVSLLALLQLQVWTPANQRVWGDKELFWLSLSMVGDESYEFNKNDAVSVGVPSFETIEIHDIDSNAVVTDIKQYNKKVKICSSHPGHLSGDDDFTLLWINSGFKYCKKDTSATDVQTNTHFRQQFNGNATLLKEYYESPMKIKAILLPEDNTFKKHNENAEMGKNLNDKFREAYGWDMSSECDFYTWCASEVLDNNGNLKNKNSIFIEYEDELVDLYEYYGRLWTLKIDAIQNIDDDTVVEVGNGQKLMI